MTLVVDRLLHLPQLLCFFFHFLHTTLHRRYLLLCRIVSPLSGKVATHVLEAA
jgi:hypothetical protein